jgi:hypothetical protein
VVWFGGEDSCIFQFFLASAGTRLNGPADKQVLKTGSAHEGGILEYILHLLLQQPKYRKKESFYEFFVCFFYRDLNAGERKA